MCFLIEINENKIEAYGFLKHFGSFSWLYVLILNYSLFFLKSLLRLRKVVFLQVASNLCRKIKIKHLENLL